MTFDAAAANALFSALKSVPLQTRLFQDVDTHEPWNAPGTGLYCSIIMGPLRPEPAKSGLNSTTGSITFTVRVWSGAMIRSPDKVDPEVLAAVATLMTAYSADYTLGQLVRNIDLMAMSAQPGWVPFEGKQFRVMDIQMPIVINDMFAQVATDD